MSRHLFRRLFVVLLAVAFFDASILQVMPAAAMQSGAGAPVAMTMAAPDGTPDSAPMPCKGMTSACMIDLGCIFMIGVPVPAASLVVDLAWKQVAYPWPSAVTADRGIRTPDLRPPIRLS